MILKYGNTQEAAAVTHLASVMTCQKKANRAISGRSDLFNFLLCSLILLPVSLCFPHSIGSIASHCDLMCVCAGGVSTFVCGWPSWNTQASCLAWIGIWFHFSLVSEAPLILFPRHSTSCWMHISNCALQLCHRYSNVYGQCQSPGTPSLLVNDLAILGRWHNWYCCT